MPKSLFISILIVTSFKLSVAAILSPRKFYDTAINPKIAATLTKKELSIIFGRDDSSKDLIQFYFAKRNKEKNDAHPGFYLRKPDCIDDNRSDFRITATNNKWADGYSKKVDDP